MSGLLLQNLSGGLREHALVQVPVRFVDAKEVVGLSDDGVKLLVFFDDMTMAPLALPSTGGSADLSDYYTKSEVDAKIDDIDAALSSVTGLV